jgi:formylglycine-generating enzyme required for sulfatase activity
VSLAIDGGTFYRTYDPVQSDGGVSIAPDGGPTALADPATVSSFRLDKYLVTVARFRAFVNHMIAGGALPADGSGKHTHLNGGQGLLNANDGPACGSSITFNPGADASSPYEYGWSSGFWSNGRDGVLGTSGQTSAASWNTALTTNCYAPYQATWTMDAGPNEDLPINCLTWYQAYAFCIWDGGFLPSEAELEYAAAGGSEQREYPWGNADPNASNRYAIHACDYPSGSTGCVTDAGSSPGTMHNIAPVGFATLGVGRWGQLDLAGEVWEWTLDAFNVYSTPCTDCAYLELLPSMSSTGIFCGSKATHGGFFNNPAYYLTPPSREYYGSNHLSSGVGVRCARAP